MAPSAVDGRAGVVPAAVRVQVRQLQAVLPGARGRAAGRAGDHRVLPGGVAVPVRQPPLHAMRTTTTTQVETATHAYTYYLLLLSRSCRDPDTARARSARADDEAPPNGWPSYS